MRTPGRGPNGTGRRLRVRKAGDGNEDSGTPAGRRGESRGDLDLPLIAGAAIFVKGGGPADEAEDDARSGEDGRFEFQRLPPGEYRLAAGEVQFSGRASFERSLTVPQAGFCEVAIDLDEGILLSGRLSLGGKPASGFRVSPSKATGEWRGHRDLTDSGGAFSLRLPRPGEYLLEISPDVRIPVTVPDGVTEHAVEVQVPSSGLSGTVVDSETGKPVAYAQVLVLPRSTGADCGPCIYAPLNYGGWDHLVRAKSTTGSDGCFCTAHLLPGDYSVQVSCFRRPYAVFRGESIKVEKDKVSEGHRFQLQPGYTFRARLLDPHGLPACLSRAFISCLDGRPLLVHSTYTLSGSRNGIVEIEGLPAGTYFLTLLPRSLAPQRVEIVVGPRAPFKVIRLEKGGALRLTVLDSTGAPAADAVVTLLDPSSQDVARILALRQLWTFPRGYALLTDARGTLCLEHLAPGSYRCVARKNALRSGEVSFSIDRGLTRELQLILNEKDTLNLKPR
jgi:hypothetical protein